MNKNVDNPHAGVGMSWFLRFFLPILAAAILAPLSGCQDQSGDQAVADETMIRLYTVEAKQGQFAATAEPNVYTLITGQVSPNVVWFSDTPLRQAGTGTLDDFMNVIWPRDFAPFPPAASIGVRAADGIWSILAGEVLNATYDQVNGSVVWTLRLQGTPDMTAQSGVVLYLDDVGSRASGEENYVFLHAAARGQFVPVVNSDVYELKLDYPLPEQIIVGAAPNFIAALLRNDLFVDYIFPYGYGDTPPNAAVTIEAPDGSISTRVVTLFDPHWDEAGERLTYQARFLDDLPPPTSAGPAIVYVDSDEEDMTVYAVVVNHEEQYSIWPADRERPLGWQDDGFYGQKADCLYHIEVVWTDMRPLSLRKKMEQMEREREQDPWYF